MNCLVYAACFMAVLPSTRATPTLAPRADQAAAVPHKGQSDEKCYFGCSNNYYGLNTNLWGLPNSYPYYPYGYSLYGGLFNTNIGFGAGLGIFKKDAAEPTKHQENSVCLGLSLA
jgi:hypothetical protein